MAPLYRTEAVTPDPQPDYLNTVAIGYTSRSPEELLELALELERRLGRERRRPLEPRPIDIDLLLVGSEIRRQPELTLPHPRLRERRFVLKPLSDLAPELPIPPEGRPVREWLAALPPRPWVERWEGSERRRPI